MKHFLASILFLSLFSANAFPDEQLDYFKNIINAAGTSNTNQKFISKFWKAHKKFIASDLIQTISRSHLEAKLLFDKILRENPSPATLAELSKIALLQIADTIYFDFQRNGNIPLLSEETLLEIAAKSLRIFEMQQNIEQVKIAIEGIDVSRIQKADKKHFKKMKHHLEKELASFETSLVKLEAYQFFKDSKFEKALGFANRHKLAIGGSILLTAAVITTLAVGFVIYKLKHTQINTESDSEEMQPVDEQQPWVDTIENTQEPVDQTKQFKIPVLPPQDPRDQKMFDELANEARAKNMQLIVRTPNPNPWQDQLLYASEQKKKRVIASKQESKHKLAQKPFLHTRTPSCGQLTLKTPVVRQSDVANQNKYNGPCDLELNPEQKDYVHDTKEILGLMRQQNQDSPKPETVEIDSESPEDEGYSGHLEDEGYSDSESDPEEETAEDKKPMLQEILFLNQKMNENFESLEKRAEKGLNSKEFKELNKEYAKYSNTALNLQKQYVEQYGRAHPALSETIETIKVALEEINNPEVRE